MTTINTETVKPDPTAEPLALRLNDQLGQASEAPQPVAYLYHDSATAETADPITNSTVLVMRRHRLPNYRSETPLITLGQAKAMVAAERERCAKLCEEWAAVRTPEHGGLALRNVAERIRKA